MATRPLALLRQYYGQYRPSSLTLSSSALALITVRPEISFLPLTLLLSTAILHSSNAALSNPQNSISIVPVPLRLAGFTLAIGIAETLANIQPSLSALSSGPVTSILALFGGSLGTSFLALLPVFIYSLLSRSFTLDSSRKVRASLRNTLFPAIWTTALVFYSRLSPFGRLGTWSPVLLNFGFGSNESGAYGWLVPYVGASGIDWIVASWAVLFVNVLQDTGLAASPERERFTIVEDDEATPDLIHFESDAPSRRVELGQDARIVTSPVHLLDDNGHAEHHRDLITSGESDHETDSTADVVAIDSRIRKQGSRSPSTSTSSWANPTFPRRSTLSLGAILLALAIPSFVVQDLPLPPYANDSTDVSLACILPPPPLPHPQSPKPPPTDFEVYLRESTLMGSQARVHLWPESAVRFESSVQKAEQIEKIRRTAEMYKIFIGVGFEDVPGLHSVGGSKRRNGMALVGPDGVVMEYYKSNLVPFTESYAITPSYDPPEIHVINLPYGSQKIGKHYPTRPISVTSSICLDLAHPSNLLSLPSRPALILAPASTWDVTIGRAMLEQARIRADEVGATLLWCDGGGTSSDDTSDNNSRGVSGVVGQHNSGFQVGRGTFVRTVGVPWRSDEAQQQPQRTVYAWGGDASVLALVWIVVLGALALGNVSRRDAESGSGSATFGRIAAYPRRLGVHVRRFIAGSVERIRRRGAVAQEVPNLIDA